MTAHPKIDKATLAAATHVQALVDEAVAAERLRIAALERQIRLQDAIMDACRSVAVATDELAQARFAGVREIPARRKVEAACKRLVTTMRRRG